MSQFDVYENRGKGKANIPFVLDVQADLVSGALSTRVVVPLYKSTLIKKAALKIHVPIIIRGQKHIALFDELASVDFEDLGPHVVNIASSHFRECRNALDTLFFNQP